MIFLYLYHKMLIKQYFFRGYYPKGGGALELKVKPIKSLKAVTLLDPGEVTGINGWAFVAGTTYIDVSTCLVHLKLFLLKHTYSTLELKNNIS